MKNKNITDKKKLLLKLYVVGMNQTAQRAFTNLEKICEEYFPNQYTIEIVNLLENPTLAVEEQIFAVPLVVKELPLPIKKVIGDLSDKEKVLVGLGLYSL